MFALLVAALIASPLRPSGMTPTRADVATLVPQAQQIRVAYSTDWMRARALANLVRETFPAGWGHCVDYASAVEQLGRYIGVPVRLAAGQARLGDSLDSHTTDEVWLAKQRRWVIVDPYFDGYFRQGRRGRLLGVFDLQRLVRQDAAGNVWWYGSPARNAMRLSSYRFNPVLAFRYVGVSAWLGGVSGTVTNPDSAGMAVAVGNVSDHMDPTARFAFNWTTQERTTAGFASPPFAAAHERVG